MSGYITFWSKDYVKSLEKSGDKGPFSVVYGSHHTRMPSISSLKTGDIVYPVAILQGTLCAMARLEVDKIEPAFDYLMRETGQRHSALIPEGILMLENAKFGDFAVFSGGCGYIDKCDIPDNIHTVIREDELKPLPHNFHQEPITCCAKTAASGKGSEIYPRPIAKEMLPDLLFGKTKSSQKPLRFNENGVPQSVSLSGFIRKMSDGTFEIFERLFKE